MKKIITFLIAITLAAGCLTACNIDGSDDGKLKIVTTIFPEYDWVMNVLGANPADAEVKLLMDNGVDLHSYQPTAEDILKISNCDLFVYVGGESDEWVDDALRAAPNDKRIVLNLLDILGDAVKEEEVVEGMEEHDHEHEEGEEHDHEHEEVEYDEHVWLSLKNAAVLVNKISESLQKLDPANAAVYKANTAAYTEKLNALDARYAQTVADASIKTLLFGDRFPFRYLTDDYGLDYYAAFVGCSAETEASFATVTFLAKKVDELGLHAVMTIEKSDGQIARTIVENTASKDQKILSLDSLQSVTAKDIGDGETYLSVMEANLTVLNEALK